jgi:8-oxo-dGTP pyrophosphatase MutT (NUDIX family)
VPIRAAGGVVVRDGKVLLVHRPRYDDWSLPKGKLEQGEDWGEGALREVREETGLDCVLGEEVGVSLYTVEGGDKEVRWFLMEPRGEPGALEHEVDELLWVALDEAAAVLSYARDVEVLSRLR